MSSSKDAERDPASPLEQETGEPDVHPEEEGQPKPDTSGEPTDEALEQRQESEESPG